MAQQTVAPPAVDSIRVTDVFPAPTPDAEIRRFAVRVEHVREGGESTEHFLIAEMPLVDALRLPASVTEHVHGCVERLGNSLPGDGRKLARLRALEPLAITAPGHFVTV